MRRAATRRLLSVGRSDVGGGRGSETEVQVRRVAVEVHVRPGQHRRHEGERTFVLVPGIGVSSNYFERLATQLNEYGPVHALDLPGFGGVPHPESGRMTIGEYADLVGTVIDELDLDDPVVVGHSMGTQVVGARTPSRHRPAAEAEEPMTTLIAEGKTAQAVAVEGIGGRPSP